MNLTQQDFKELLDVPILPKACLDIIRNKNFDYTIIDGKEKDDIVLGIIKDLERGFSKTGDRDKWEKGWGENLKDFSESHDPKSLVPKYYKKTPLRYNQDFVWGCDGLETNVFDVITTWVASTFIKHVDRVYEFGCGPGHNLLKFHSMYPNKEFVGLDWASSSQKIIHEMGLDNITGIQFDMFYPPKVNLGEKSMVLTVGALEQLGNKFVNMFDYWMSQPVDIFIHIEPIAEMYDLDNLLDYLAHKFTLHRNYLHNYLPHLKGQGVNILKETRVPFGSLYHEGWNIVIWEK